MSSATLCFTGFARDDLAQAQALFEQASAARAQRWSQAPEADAEVLVIDMDSMYGHMTWLRAAGSGRRTVGVTAGERCETDFMLRRPLDVEGFQALLGQLETGVARPLTPEPQLAPEPAAGPVVEPLLAPQRETEPEPAAANPGAGIPAEQPTAAGETAAPPAEPTPHRPALSDLLAPGVFTGPVRLRLAGAPDLLLDPATQTYAGSSTLKPLLPWVKAELSASDAEPVEASDVAAQRASAQPYMRLLWLCGLTVGEGQLLPGHPDSGRLVLTRWPQIEREFPKHFRIATVMMKGPALVQDIADASGGSLAEVCDFVNAGLVTGAVVAEGSPPAGGDTARAVALLARPRAA